MRPLLQITLVAGTLSLAACTPPQPSARQDAPPPAEPGISLSGYATVGVAKTF
ncbi:hypothetical protein K3758_04635 [Sulfitobacter sp. W002]|uniref:hypothetical protein n=1 Tax=unclassified Sulfitobacter TaxID=196795 RepID=UPI0021A2CDD2|nr:MULTISPECIES: hypothetical protein [unclassified Sulfitobacter]UWR30822.1 hypothetical protein K3758_04635 [Sulfitobacter sp. W002]WPZ28714.1 hypothetical protein T8A63_13915 [Sulfitobacter sp. OXR-159]